jgi:hypothetical protein
LRDQRLLVHDLQLEDEALYFPDRFALRSYQGCYLLYLDRDIWVFALYPGDYL